MAMTLADIDAEQAKPENRNRPAILVYENGNEFVAEWEGVEVRAGNPFGLDSKLSAIGAPRPRNLYLTEESPDA